MEEEAATSGRSKRWYPHYVLGVLMLVYVFNFVDRHILSILAESIKADLGVTDAQMGFLYGTVFAVFYALFGLPLARFADVWVRRSVISAGLLFWSAMTALSGFARSFAELAAYRTGVGVGEASASPAAYSLLYDYYPPRLRATVVATYSGGGYIGVGLGLFLGGAILDFWTEAYPENPPFGLKGWQVAFMMVGLPGLLMAAWVRSLREPVRGISEGLVTETHPTPFRVLGAEVASIVPPLNIMALARQRASLRLNALVALVIAGSSGLLIWLTGDWAQWIALGIGVYAAASWVQGLARRDPATFAMIFRSKAMIYMLVAFTSVTFVTYGIGFWTSPYLIRAHGANPLEVGLYVGMGIAVGGLLAVTTGGYIADRLRLRFTTGRLVVGYFIVFGTVPTVLLLLYTDSLLVAFLANFLYHLPSACWAGIPPSTASDLVLPRMRAVAGAFYILLSTFVGLALGPYAVGKFSDLLVAQGMGDGDALRLAMASSMVMFVVSVYCLVQAQRHLPRDEASRVERARALGEEVVELPVRA